MQARRKTGKKVFFAGSSHTRLFFLFMKDFFAEKASVSKLPYDAGNTAEILGTIRYWPLEDKNIVHVYTGHRDLMPDETGRPFIDAERFRGNLRQIIEILLARTPGRVVFSNIPPVAESYLQTDPRRNERISRYNEIIATVSEDAGILVHDFSGFVRTCPDAEDKYIDGLHFSRKFYKEYGKSLAKFLLELL
jgi:lysophospholipase L1-like esterase